MITGFNTDIKHDGKVYHVQTEDKGEGNPFIESLVYVGGEILASKKTSYAERLTEGADEKTIAQLMELQHKTIIAAIKRGRFDKAGEVVDRAKTVAAETSTPHPPIEEEKTLDQVILDYLASEAESEHLELNLSTPVDFVAGQPFELQVTALRSLSQQPIEAATIEVKVISTIEPPRVIFRGTTDSEGTATVKAVVPVFTEGTAAVIISAQSELGNDELKQLVKRKK
ncbi:MAG: hypothetical protein R3338_12265 [Thermoanaerobaculia bacterium]|nr:hypothetical protein [Thermoanaerobaculia bacterium]